MSNPLAIAAVTAVLKNRLDNGLIEDAVSSAVGTTVTVSTLAPDRVTTGSTEVAQLNLFLYHVAPNAAWRNVGQPARDRAGNRTANAPLALDLYYLLSAYGKNSLEPEILLGYAAHLLHEAPVLTRAVVRRALQGATSPATLLPAAFQALALSELAEQIELVKITPHTLSTEEVSKLWTAFQAKFRPSVAYCASVVLIEAKSPARSALPVLERTVTARASLLPPFPTLEQIEPPNGQTAARLGEALTLRGHHLDGGTPLARFTNLRTRKSLELPALASPTRSAFAVQLPAAATAPPDWIAGVYSVAAIIRRVGEPDRVSSELPLALAPTLASATAAKAGGVVTLTIGCRPHVVPGQPVSVVVGSREIAAESVNAATPTLTFKTPETKVASGPQWVRLRVDGVESILIDRSGTAPEFDPAAGVTV